jgi:hypothetical protein
MISVRPVRTALVRGAPANGAQPQLRWLPGAAQCNRSSNMQIKNSGATSSPTAGVSHGAANMEAPHVWLASEIIGMEVESKTTDHLGKIVDVVIHADQTPSYAVLSFGGWLGMGDKLFAVPWPALTLDTANKRFTLNVQKNALKDAPGFDKDHWPSMSDRTWATGVHKFYGTTYSA